MNRRRFAIAIGALSLSVILAVLSLMSTAVQDFVLGFIAHLEQLLETHYWSAIVIYIVTFAALITATLPLATLLTITGGYLFGLPAGAAAALTAMTLGALATFKLIRFLGLEVEQSRLRSGRAKTVFELLDHNAVLYVTLLRVVPVAPCFAVNAGAAMTHLGTGKFILASLAGLTPSAVVYASAGAGLDELLDASEIVTFRLLLQPEIGLPLVGIVVLVTLSWLVRRHLPGGTVRS